MVSITRVFSPFLFMQIQRAIWITNCFWCFLAFQITYWKQPAEFKYWILNSLFIYKPLLNMDNGSAVPESNNLEWKVEHWNSKWILGFG